jgi:hypothetical protein
MVGGDDEMISCTLVYTFTPHSSMVPAWKLRCVVEGVGGCLNYGHRSEFYGDSESEVRKIPSSKPTENQGPENPDLTVH